MLDAGRVRWVRLRDLGLILESRVDCMEDAETYAVQTMRPVMSSNEIQSPSHTHGRGSCVTHM